MLTSLQNPPEGCLTWSVDGENRPQRGQFFPGLQPHSPAMEQKDGVTGGPLALAFFGTGSWSVDARQSGR